MKMKLVLRNVFLLMLFYQIANRTLTQMRNADLALKDWMKEKGAYINPKVLIKYLMKDNRFLLVNDDMKKGEPIVIVPDELIIRTRNPSISELCTEAGAEATRLECLSYYICHEMHKEDTVWRPFLDFLPHDYYTYPMFYSQKQQELIKNTMVTTTLKNVMDKSLRENYSKIRNPSFTFDEYLKCRLIVWSRNFKIYENDKPDNAVVPFADLFNYDPKKTNTSWHFNSSTGKFEVIAKRPIKKGEEILVGYGKHANYHYLFFYGFTIPSNPTKLNKLKINQNDLKFELPYPPNLSKVLPLFRKDSSSEIEKNRFEERQALKAMKEELTKVLNGYSDKIKPNAKSKDFTLSNIYRVVLEEKKILGRYLEVIRKCISFLNDPKEKRDILMKYIKKKKRISPDYIHEILRAFS